MAEGRGPLNCIDIARGIVDVDDITLHQLIQRTTRAIAPPTF